MCPENHKKRGTQRGTLTPVLGPQKRSEMKVLSRTIRRARGKHCARLRYIDDDGKKHELLRTAESKSEAKTKLAQLETELMEKDQRDWRPVKLRLDSLLNTRLRGSTNPLLTMRQDVK